MNVYQENKTQPFHATVISTNGCGRNQKTQKHLENMAITYTFDLEEPISLPEQANFTLTRFDVLRYKQSPISLVATQRHINVLKRALERDHFPHLIMENDVRFTSKERFDAAMEKALTTKYRWNVFFFSCLPYPMLLRVPIVNEPSLHYIPTALMAHAYMVHKESAQQIVDLSERYPKLVFDKIFKFVSRCVCIWPEVSYQTDNPHHLQAMMKKSDGNEWVLSFHNSVAMGVFITVILFAGIYVATMIAKYPRSSKHVENANDNNNGDEA